MVADWLAQSSEYQQDIEKLNPIHIIVIGVDGSFASLWA